MAEKTEHTPGPWSALEWERNAGGTDWNVWGPKRSNHVGDDNLCGDFGSEADARLISAAPEMLHALKAAVSQVHLSEMTEPMSPSVKLVFDQCCAAISKAEGRS